MRNKKLYGHIVSTPRVCGGKPRIDGHRIRVQDIVIEYQWHGRSPEEICRQHPSLNLGKVHAALAYYFDHQQKILADIAEDEKLYSDFMSRHPNGAERA